MNRLRLALLFCAFLCWTAAAHATTVAVVRPARPSAEATEALIRLHGELLSVGIDVTFADAQSPGPSDSPQWLENLASARGAQAVIVLVGEGMPLAADVWVMEKPSPRAPVARVMVEPNTGNASERLAIRAVEVLRSSLLEADFAARERRQEPKVIAVPNDGETPDAQRFGLEAGAAVVTSLDGMGPALVPVVRFNWAARSWLVVQATLAGLGTHPTVATSTSSARLAQQFGGLGGCYRFRSSAWLRPYFALAAGAEHTSIEGRADAPNQGHSVEQWSFLLDGGVGAVLPLSERTYLNLAAHAQLAEPYVAIHFGDEVVATTGRPNLLLSLTLGAWL